ncbi:MAG TPA: Gfo/Idh/MocA family oxidoreductase [Candidatus Saccharimonadales bacterium]|nr:Gfo/Idh/MocA family oxidoreductase [Candidatus Saccharimonadales bacterium]
MNHKTSNGEQIDLNRRSFLRTGSMTTLVAMMGGVPLKAEDKPKDAPAPPEEKHVAPPVNCAVIGCGVQGREIINTLARLPNAPVVAVCDTYEPFLRRGKEAAPNAVAETDYKKVFGQKDVQAVFIATPTHQHKDLVLEALKAGKHVYCEAPIANTIEDARTIAQAAKSAYKLNFQSGLQMRSEPQRHFLLQFIRSGAMGKTVKARAQWQKKQSWRRSSPNPEREKDVNWRLRRSISTGLAGEIGIHQIDAANWFINEKPSFVMGFGSILNWNDGRDVPDTVQAILGYPSGVHTSFECTLANSFDADYEMFFGTDSAVMLRQNKAWMFKEVDSPLLGWEVYARKDEFYKETGIALVANATKLIAQGNKPVEDAPYTNTSLSYALESFIANTGTIAASVEDFTGNFGENEAGLKKYLAEVTKTRLPAAGYQEGFEATVVAIKANEAILNGQKIELPKEFFQV